MRCYLTLQRQQCIQTRIPKPLRATNPDAICYKALILKCLQLLRFCMGLFLDNFFRNHSEFRLFKMSSPTAKFTHTKLDNFEQGKNAGV